jgi:predicted O-methyltransferase YrrM
VEHGVEDRITRCEGTSFEWADKLLDKKFDFTFIDGNHSYDYVLKDAQNAMRNAGLIGFHDTNMNAVDRALTDSGILEWELIESADRIKIFRRRA